MSWEFTWGEVPVWIYETCNKEDCKNKEGEAYCPIMLPMEYK